MISWGWPWPFSLLLPPLEYCNCRHVQVCWFDMVLGIHTCLAKAWLTEPYPQPKSSSLVEMLSKPTFVDGTIHKHSILNNINIPLSFYYCLCVCVHIFPDMCASTICLQIIHCTEFFLEKLLCFVCTWGTTHISIVVNNYVWLNLSDLSFQYEGRNMCFSRKEINMSMW